MNEYPTGYESITPKPAMQSDWWKSPYQHSLSNEYEQLSILADRYEDLMDCARTEMKFCRQRIDELLKKEAEAECKTCGCYAKDEQGNCRNCGGK